jgi:hypothetical protein
MSICNICGSVDKTKPSNEVRECTVCLAEDINNTDGTFTPKEKRFIGYIKRQKT